jgi:predicted DNA-binding transcriptional regulator YafY
MTDAFMEAFNDNDLPLPPRGAGSAKLQRWVDLLASLLDRRTAATFEELARDVPVYATMMSAYSDLPAGTERERRKQSLKRMFERDKDELRELGIPLESQQDADGNPGGAYALRKRDFYLPYLSLTAPSGESIKQVARVDQYGYHSLASLALGPAELAVIVDAAGVVRSLGDPLLAADVARALRKLAVDLPLDAMAIGTEPTIVLPRARAENAVFAVLSEALRRRKTLTFEYHTIGSDATATRTVDPYGLFFTYGHWYLVAHDQARGQLRNFRLSRIAAPAANTAKKSTPDYEVPASFRLAEHGASRFAWELGDADVVPVRVRVVGDTGPVRAAAALGQPVPDEPTQRAFTVRRRDAFVRWLLSSAGGLVPIEPPQLVSAYQDALRQIAALYAPDRAPSSAAASATPPASRSVPPGEPADPWQATTAAAQLRRILHLVPAIATAGEHDIDAVAAQLGVDVTTLQRDVYSLVERYDIPGGFVECVQIYLESGRLSARAQHFLRPMRLTGSELAALALGLTVLRRRRTPEQHAVIERARDQLMAVAAKLPDDPIPVLPYVVDSDQIMRSAVVGTLCTALQQRTAVTICYRGSNDREASDRVIRLYAMTMVNGVLYAVAYCEREQDVRVFRPDRIEAVHPSSSVYSIPDDFSLDALVRDGRLLHGQHTRTLRVWYSPVVARWIAEREGLTPAADGSLMVEYPLADDEWAVRHVLQYGVEAEVVAPEEVREMVRARVGGMLGA